MGNGTEREREKTCRKKAERVKKKTNRSQNEKGRKTVDVIGG